MPQARRDARGRAGVRIKMGLFPPHWMRPNKKELISAPKTIPPEVFDRRAVEKGQVRFHDVAYIEVTPRFSVVAQPSRLRVRAASRRTKDHGAGRSVNSQARRPRYNPRPDRRRGVDGFLRLYSQGPRDAIAGRFKGRQKRSRL